MEAFQAFKSFCLPFLTIGTEHSLPIVQMLLILHYGRWQKLHKLLSVTLITNCLGQNWLMVNDGNGIRRK